MGLQNSGRFLAGILALAFTAKMNKDLAAIAKYEGIAKNFHQPRRAKSSFKQNKRRGF